jgi:subtilisin family serine protease
MGIMVGGDGRGPFTDDIGVAPGATWMAAKACESFSCSDAALIESAQWIACPTDGSVPDCTMAPDVVHSAWGETAHDLWFATYVNTWRAAGIIPVFPAGSAGSSCRTIGSPADYPNLIAVGATTESDVLADFSSKGPGFRLRPVKPDLVAPGSDVRSSTNTSDTSYGSLSGSQMGSAHVAGAVALLLSADPTLTYRDVLSALQTTTNRALDAPPGPDACAGIRYNRYPNMIYGFGQIDAAAALGLP